MQRDFTKQEPIQFRIRIEPISHNYIVEMEFSSNSEETILFLPSWSPGSYMIRDYSRHIHSFRSNMNWEQLDLSRWKLVSKTQDRIHITYSVYAYEDLTVRTNHLEEDFGLIQPPALFLCPIGHESSLILIEFLIGDYFSNVYTQLNKTGDIQFQSKGYDLLYDSPFILSNAKSIPFSAFGIPHEILFQGEISLQKQKELIEDLQKVIEIESEMMGSNPNPSYLFVLILIDGGYGGLEHSASSINIFDGNKLSDPKEYKKLVELLAHEYFHLWNIKRIRPIAFGPFDYERPNLSRELWIAEGITSFYDAYFLLVARILDEKEYLDKISEDYHLLLDHLGEEVMSLEESSFTAWNKLYKRTADSLNTSISYYTKGAILSLAMNAWILAKTDGEKSLSDVMRRLYNSYIQSSEKGFTKSEFFDTAFIATGVDLYLEFGKYLELPGRIPIEKYLECMGIEYFKEGELGSLGITLREDSGSLFVQRINRKLVNSDLQLSLGDEILGIEKFRIRTNSEWKEKVRRASPGDRIDIIYSRGGKIRTTQALVEIGYEKRGFRFRENISDKELSLWKKFLN